MIRLSFNAFLIFWKVVRATTEKEKELLLAYIVNQDFRIDSEISEFIQKLRFRHISLNDLFEGMVLFQRRDDFNDFALTVLRLLHLNDFD